MLVLDSQGRIVRLNKAFQRISGYTLDEAQGKFPLDSSLTAQHGHSGDEFFHEALSNHFPTEYESMLLAKDGSGHVISWAGTGLIGGKSHETYVVATGIDITECKRAQEALLAEKEKAERYLNIAEVILVAMDTEAKITLINRKGCQIVGYEREELIGKDWFRVALPPEEYEQVYCVYLKIIAGDIEPFEYYENRVLTKKGEKRDIAWHNTVIRDEMGRIIGALSSGEDVTERRKAEGALRKSKEELEVRVKERTTELEAVNANLLLEIAERKRAEEALRQREEFLSSIVENIPDMIFIKDAKELRFVRFNRAGEKLLGYKREDLIGKNDYDFFTKKDVEVLESGQVYDIPEEPIETKKGERILHTTKMPILDKTGNPIYLLGISEDITEGKQAEEKNLRLAAIVESSDDAIFGISLDGTITSWNKGAENIYGYKDTEALGKPIFLLAPTDRQDEVLGLLERINRGEHIKHFETVRRKKDGREIDVSLTISLIRNVEGRTTGISTIARDITERKRAEEAVKRANKDWEQTFDAIPDMVMVLDTHYRILRANKAMAAVPRTLGTRTERKVLF